MRIALASDLHLEFGDIDLKNTEGADVLILSGDICVANVLHEHPDIHLHRPTDPNRIWKLSGKQELAIRVREFLNRVSQEFDNVIYIAGNHEFYGGSFPDAIDWLRKECEPYNNVHFLEMDTVTIDDFTFIGGTLWTDMNKNDPLTLHAVGDMMNDFRIIRNSERSYAKFSTHDASIRHSKTLAYIKTVVAEKHDQKFVVVGHHGPSFQSVHEIYKHEYLMNGGYCSELSWFIMDHPQIKLWTHGHTHELFDYMIGDCRVVCNPRGYIGHEQISLDFKLKVVEL